jgi:hypothetical protein
MVYLREVLKQNRDRLIQYKNIELVAYLFVLSPEELSNHDFELTPEEEIALKGYKNEPVESSKIVTVVSKAPVKGISAVSNVYKFAGLYLAAKEELKNALTGKYQQSDLKQKYFLSKIAPDLITQLQTDVAILSKEPFGVIIKQLFALERNDTELNVALESIVKMELDVQAQILLEDLEKALLKVKYVNKTTEDVVRGILNNFSNAIQKITKNRRSGHAEFKIEDEYDVQDILYVILKSVFPTLRDEDAIPKVGGKSTKIDLILREEKILIEVKMLKGKDINETHFIEQLKVDFESYHECQWLNKLFCFVYDPYKKTRDISNFQDMNGNRTKGGHSFNVELIVVN